MAASHFKEMSGLTVADRGASMLRWSRCGRVAGGRVGARGMSAMGTRAGQSFIDFSNSCTASEGGLRFEAI